MTTTARAEVGDHVQLKGLTLDGFSGTVVKRQGWLGGRLLVQLDPGQLRLGHSLVAARQRNIERVTCIHRTNNQCVADGCSGGLLTR